MPPGIGNTGLGNAVANVIINTNSMRNATTVASGFGRAVTAGQNQAAAAINKTIATQQQQTATMRVNLQLLNAQIAAYARFGGAAGQVNQTILNGMVDQSTRLREQIALQAKATDTLKTQVGGAIELGNKTRQNNQLFSEGAASLLAMGAAAAQVFNTGINSAGFLEQQNVAFASIAGSLTGGIELVNRLKQASADLSIPFNETVMAVRTILPTMEGNTSQLEKQLDIMRRLVAINPIQGMSGAGFSINEYMVSGGGDARSLRGRFNIPTGILADELKKSSGDMWEALDQTLNRMKVTTDMADNMGQTFVNAMMMAKDATVQLLAEGFDPLIKKATPKLLDFAKWVQDIRQGNKELIGWGVALTSVLAVSTPILFFLGKWYSMMKSIVAATWAAGVAMKANIGSLKQLAPYGLYAGAAVAGAYVGKGIGNTIQKATGQEESSWSDMLETAKQLLFIAVSEIVQQVLLIRQGLGLVNAALIDGSAAIRYAVADLMKSFGFDATEQTRKGDELGRQAADTRSAAYQAGSHENLTKIMQSVYATLFVTNNTSNTSIASKGSGRQGVSELNSDQQDTVYQYFRDLDNLTSKHYSEVVDAERQFGQQRADAAAQYTQQMAREEEDFQRGRLRAEQDFTRQIQILTRDSQRQEAEWNQDLADTIAEINLDSNDKLTDIQESYNKDREERERQHKTKLMEAAAMLDAKAVWEEMNSYSEANKKAEDDYNEQRSKEQDKRQERIQDEIDAHDKRIAESRAADELRLADMKENFARQKALEDEDRAIKLQRTAQDYAQQLAKMDAQQAERMAAIETQFVQEKKNLEDKFRDELKDQALFGTTWLKNQQMWQDEALRRFGLFFKDITDTMLGKMGPLTEQEMRDRKQASDNQIPTFINSFADYIPTPQTIIKNAPNKSAESKSLNISKGAIVVNPTQGMSEEKVGDIIMDRLLRTFEYVGAN